MSVPQHQHLAIFLSDFFGDNKQEMLTLAHAVAARGYRVHIVQLQSDESTRNLSSTPVRTVDLKATNAVLALTRLAGYLWRERPYSLLSAHPSGNLVTLLARWLSGMPIRIIVSEQDGLATGTEQSGRAFRWLKSRFVRSLYRYVDGVIVRSERKPLERTAMKASQTILHQMEKAKVVHAHIVTTSQEEISEQVVDQYVNMLFDTAQPTFSEHAAAPRLIPQQL